MKLSAVQVYVAVEFGTRRTKYNYFSDRNELTGLQMELLKEYQMVSIKLNEHQVLIPCANVAYAVPADAKGSVKSREPKLGESSIEASHPRLKG